MQFNLLFLLFLLCVWPVECKRRPTQPSRKPQTLRRHQPEIKRSAKSVEDRGCIPTDGTAYSGNVNTTESGLTCEIWSESVDADYDYTDVGEHNFCRSPDDNDKVWCYTTDPGKLWEFCDVPICPRVINCLPADARDYTGNVSITKSGLTCEMWSNAGYHMEHNYCRSPDGDTKVWCFPADPKHPWEYCDVPPCKDVKGKCSNNKIKLKIQHTGNTRPSRTCVVQDYRFYTMSLSQ